MDNMRDIKDYAEATFFGIFYKMKLEGYFPDATIGDIIKASECHFSDKADLVCNGALKLGRRDG